MATNPYISNFTNINEQNLVENITIELIQGMGQDCLYIPREYLSIDHVFGEDPGTSFTKAYTLEMYTLSFKGFDGTDVVSQFGIEIRDKVNLIFARKRFAKEITYKEPSITRPREGDLIYFPLSKSLFEINFVEHENPLYPLGKLYSYTITAELFTYSYEKMATNNSKIDILMNNTRGYSGSQIIPINNNLGTTAGINDRLDIESEEYYFNPNNPYLGCCASSDISPLDPAKSFLDYEVWASTFYDVPNTVWNYSGTTASYDTLSVVPSVQMIGKQNNGWRTVNITNGSDYDFSTLHIKKLKSIPNSRRVMIPYYFWIDTPTFSKTYYDYYKNTPDGITYSGTRLLGIWNDVEYTDYKTSVKAVLKKYSDSNLIFDYLYDDREVGSPIWDLDGYNNYYSQGICVNNAAGTTMPFTDGYMPDARAQAAIINDSRFNSTVNPQTNKTFAQSFLDYYKYFSNQPNLSSTASQVLSKWAGITLAGDFCFAGESKRGYYSCYGQGTSYSASHIQDEFYMKYSWSATIREWLYGYYSSRGILEALSEDANLNEVEYSNYEAYPINKTESVYALDSSGYQMFLPEYSNISGGKGFYGGGGYIIYYPPSPYSPEMSSGYAKTPVTDLQKYSWVGLGDSSYETNNPSAGLVRYANNTSDADFNSQVSYKMLVDDVKKLRHMLISSPSFWQKHVPIVTPGNLEFTNLYTYDIGYWYEMMYHIILHGVLYIMHFEGNDIPERRKMVHSALEVWRTKSHNSKAQPCSNSKGDVDSNVDRVLLKDAMENVLMSGGKLLKSEKYLWRITVPPKFFDSGGMATLIRNGTDNDIPDKIIISSAVVEESKGCWILRNNSTPPSYSPVKP
jgi:hypothetical protein